MRHASSAFLLPLLLLGAPTLGLAADELFKLLPGDGGVDDEFGKDLAIDGDLVLVGAPKDDDQGSQSGSAYLFDATTGQQLHKLLPLDGEKGAYFGWAVALDGPFAVVGAWGDTHNGIKSGSAYVFDTVTGQQVAKLSAGDASHNDRFGFSVAISGTTVLVGAYFDQINGLMTGSAYLFDATTGQELLKLVAADGQDGDLLGEDVALDGTTALIGASLDDDLGNVSGSAYVFDTTTGQQTAKLLASDGKASGRFGEALDLDGGVAVISAQRGLENPDFSRVYLFDATTGVELGKLFAEDPKTLSGFGWTVALDGGTLLVGHPGGNNSLGEAVLIDLETRAQIALLRASDSEAEDQAGSVVALSGGRALFSAIADDDNGSRSGSAYLFDADFDLGDSYCGPANQNSSGNSGTIRAFGSDLVAENDVLLAAGGLPANQFGYFLTSQTQGFVANPGGSQGNLCLGGTIGRYVKQVRNSGAGGTFSLQLDLTDLPAPLVGGVQGGETWNFTTWFRDKNPGTTSNFTDAVSILFQ